MKLKKLSILEFDDFSNNHPLGSYHQSSNYAMFMSENGFDYELIGLVDDNNKIVAASLILIKKMGLFLKYGYAPKGFLIDYADTELLKKFCSLIKKRYYRKNLAFIKINPEIPIGTLKNNEIEYNDNKDLIKDLENIGFKKLIDNKLFESMLPRFNAFINLNDFTVEKADKRTRNKIRKSEKKGFSFIKGERKDIEIIYNFIKKKKNAPIEHYYNYYNAFSKSDNIDIFLVKLNFHDALISTNKNYEKEMERNDILVSKFMKDNSQENLRKKMDSDHILDSLNNDISFITKCLGTKEEEYIAGAITIKYKNRVNILISGYSSKYKQFNPNHYLHNQLIEYYKYEYEFLDLNGITGDFTEKNPFKGLNDFKLGFNPIAFELIGELDFIINEGVYINMESNGLLAKEFDRTELNKPTPKEVTPKVKPKKTEEKKPKKSFITISK